MSDVMHGPKVADGRRRRKTFLLAFIDDATRVIPFAAFAYSENTTAFLPVFKQAIARRGLPARLYVEYVPWHIFGHMFPAELCGDRRQSSDLRSHHLRNTAHNIPPMISSQSIVEGGCHAGTVLHQATDTGSDSPFVAGRADRELRHLAHRARVCRAQRLSLRSDPHALRRVRSRSRGEHLRRAPGARRWLRGALGANASPPSTHQTSKALGGQ